MNRRRNPALAIGLALLLLLVATIATLIALDFDVTVSVDVQRPGATADAPDDTATPERRRLRGSAERDGVVEEAAANATVPLMPRICRLDVTVVSVGTQRAVPAARVSYTAPEGTTNAAETDAEGIAVLHDVPWSKLRVRVAADGYATDERDVRTLPLGGRLGVEIALDRETPLRIVVRDTWSRGPVAGAVVEAFREGPDLPEAGADPGRLVAQGDSATDGRVTLRGVGKSCVLRVTGDGLETTHTRIRQARSDADREVVLWTARGGVVRGNVTNAAGAPVAGVTVRLSPWHEEASGDARSRRRVMPVGRVLMDASGSDRQEPRPTLTAVTDARGRYRIEGLRRGTLYLLRALDPYDADIGRPARVRLGRDAPEHVRDITVERPPQPEGIDIEYVFPDLGTEIGEATVRGRVTDDAGRPIRDARVWIAGATQATYSEPDGTFEIRGVVAGGCTVRAGADHHGTASVDTTAPARDVVLSIRLLDEAAGAAAASEVRFTAVLRGDGPPPLWLFVRGGSSLTTRPWPGASRRTTISLPWRAARSRSLHVTGQGVLPTEITVPAGGGALLDLGDVLLDTGVRIRGAVIDDLGTPVAGAAVVVRGPDGDLLARIITGSDGSFVVGGLGPGTHSVVAISDRHANRGEDVVIRAEGDTEIALAPIALTREVPLQVMVRDEEGLPIQGASLRFTPALPEKHTDRSGAAQLWLAPGRYTVHAIGPGGDRESPRRTVELTRGNAATEVVLEIRRRGDE